jgi:hypothetical protein
LFKEGDSADYVYIICDGEYEVFKKMVKMGSKLENITEIMGNPLKANRLQSKLFKGNRVREEEVI